MPEQERNHVLPSKKTAGPEVVAPPSTEAGETPVIDVRNLALTVVAVLAVVIVLQYAQSVLIPIVIGILISYGLAPFVAGLHRLRVPRAIGAAIAVMTLLGALGLAGYTLSDQAMSIVSDIPQAAQRLRERVRSHRQNPQGAIEKVQQAAQEIDKAAQEASTPTPAEKRTARQVQEATGVQKVEIVDPPFRATDYLWTGSQTLVGVGTQLVLVLFLVYFFLVTGDLYKRKVVKIAGPTLTKKKITVQILDEINQQIESFIRVQVFTSFVVAVATGLALWWFGVEHPIVWGLLAGVFNSIPYLGPLIVTGGLAVVGFIQFDDLIKTAYVCAVAFAITSLEGFLLTPMLMSRAAQMNPVAIFVGLLFWSWIWGVWGTVLAVPMLMMLKAICDHVEDLQPIGELLGE
jgi:predicted PurR-regulated permease PerM